MIFRRHPARAVCDCGLKAEVVLNPPREALMALARAVKPAARHYHHAAYWRHLYDDNPFRPKNLPWAVALMVDGVAEAMVTAVGVPTTQGPGALLAAWMRQPTCHATMAGALVMQPYLARQDVQLLAYDPSAEAARFYERAGWRRFDAREWSGSVDVFELRSRRAAQSSRRHPWATLRKLYPWSIDRGEDFWRWRFGTIAPAYHCYAKLARDGVSLVVGRETGKLRIEDIVSDRDDQIEDALRTVAENALAGQETVMETNHPAVEEAARDLGLSPTRSVPLYWRGAPENATCYRSLADSDFGVRKWW